MRPDIAVKYLLFTIMFGNNDSVQMLPKYFLVGLVLRSVESVDVEILMVANK